MLHPEFLPNFGLFVIGICKLNLAVLIKKGFCRLKKTLKSWLSVHFSPFWFVNSGGRMSFVPCFRCLFRIFHLNFRVFRVLNWLLTLNTLLWGLWELCKMCYLPSETPKKGPFFTFSDFFFTTEKTCFLICAGGLVRFKTNLSRPDSRIWPFFIVF